jgi:hypothetical protein
MRAHTARGAVEYAEAGAGTPVVHRSVDTDVTPDHGERAATTIPAAERVCPGIHPDAAETRKRAAALLSAPDG